MKSFRSCASIRKLFILCFSLGAILCVTQRPSFAQNQGFQVNRFEPTPAGERSFYVDHPWYSWKPSISLGLTLDYAYNPLSFGLLQGQTQYSQVQVVIGHQLISHLDFAGSFLNRFLVSASLPITLYEKGIDQNDNRYGITPLETIAAGDPRLGVMVRLWGEAGKTPISIHAGSYLWIPVRPAFEQVGDPGLRFMPKILLTGDHALRDSHALSWSFYTAFAYRPASNLGQPPNQMSSAGVVQQDSTFNAMGSQLHLGASIYYVNEKHRFQVGPEVVFDTVVNQGNPFTKASSHFEALLAGHYQPKEEIQLGLAVGTGALNSAGTPDFRGLFRIAYAPFRKPLAPAKPAPTTTCPIVDKEKLDPDGDDVLGEQDQCPTQSAGPHPNLAKPGCPDIDTDQDGVYDYYDKCKTIPQGKFPDPNRPGCPADQDGDQIPDEQDRCPTLAAGNDPDPKKNGCPRPLPDQDGDTVPDFIDACPDRPGPPHPDPKKNGCPGMVMLTKESIQIFEQIHFASDKDKILPISFPTLEAVANILIARPALRISINGHTDSRNTREYNLDLSHRRAQSVRRWLIERGGVEPSRLEFHGYGPDQPIDSNQTAIGRAKNRRVEFKIINPSTSP